LFRDIGFNIKDSTSKKGAKAESWLENDLAWSYILALSVAQVPEVDMQLNAAT